MGLRMPTTCRRGGGGRFSWRRAPAPGCLTEGAAARSSGELPWRTNFGAGLALLRHQRNDAALKELARVYVRDALKRWVPGAILVSLAVEQDGPALTLRVRVRERETSAAVAVSIER